MAPFQTEMRAICPTPLSPQICLLTIGFSLSQDLVMDRIHSSLLYIRINHGSHFMFFRKMQVDSLHWGLNIGC